MRATGNPNPHRRSHTRALAAALALAGCSLALAACGASSQSASGSNPNHAQILTESLSFTRCVRANGVPSFPDPPGSGYGVKSFAQQSNAKTVSINGVSVNAPAFRSALAKCEQYLPQPPAPTTSQLAKIRALMVTWAKCMRSHGLPKFGDPTFTADGHRIMHGDFNIGSPAYYAARAACDPQLNRSIGASGV